MLRSELVFSGFNGTLWEAAYDKARASQDASVVLARAGTVRIAVIDGRTPAVDAPTVLGCDLGIHAAQIVRHALHGDGTLEEALELANRFLHAEQDTAKSAHPEASCVAADIGADGARIVQAGDCDAWTFEAEGWRRLFPEGAMTGEAAERDRAWYAQSAELDLPTLLRLERERDYVNTESAWRTSAVGRFPRVKLDCMTLEEWETLLLASDGARLTAARLARLDAWLAELREWERGASPEEGVFAWKPHDDVTVLRIQRAS